MSCELLTLERSGRLDVSTEALLLRRLAEARPFFFEAGTAPTRSWPGGGMGDVSACAQRVCV